MRLSTFPTNTSRLLLQPCFEGIHAASAYSTGISIRHRSGPPSASDHSPQPHILRPLNWTQPAAPPAPNDCRESTISGLVCLYHLLSQLTHVQQDCGAQRPAAHFPDQQALPQAEAPTPSTSFFFPAPHRQIVSVTPRSQTTPGLLYSPPCRLA